MTVGSRLRLVPNHACAAVNLHRQMYVVDGGEITDVWPVGAADGRQP